MTVQVGLQRESLATDTALVRLVTFWSGPYHSKVTRNRPHDGWSGVVHVGILWNFFSEAVLMFQL